MNRFFSSDCESDALITIAAKCHGMKKGELINRAIKNEFLPTSEPFRTEAASILRYHTTGELDIQKIKHSLSRGIHALEAHPIHDSSALKGLFAQYNLYEASADFIIQTDALWESIIEIYKILNQPSLITVSGKINVPCLTDDIFANWNILWREKAVYDVLATIAYRYDPYHPLDWFECITFLKNIERSVFLQWSNAPNAKK